MFLLRDIEDGTRRIPNSTDGASPLYSVVKGGKPFLPVGTETAKEKMRGSDRATNWSESGCTEATTFALHYFLSLYGVFFSRPTDVLRVRTRLPKAGRPGR